MGIEKWLYLGPLALRDFIESEMECRFGSKKGKKKKTQPFQMPAVTKGRKGSRNEGVYVHLSMLGLGGREEVGDRTDGRGYAWLKGTRWEEVEGLGGGSGRVGDSACTCVCVRARATIFDFFHAQSSSSSVFLPLSPSTNPGSFCDSLWFNRDPRIQRILRWTPPTGCRLQQRTK